MICTRIRISKPAHLVKRALATLALRPEPSERCLGLRGQRDLLRVQLRRLWTAVVADGLVCDRIRMIS